MDESDQTTKRPTKPRRRHGLGAEGIGAMLARQDGRCAICGVQHTMKPGGRLAVDHDHRHCPGKQGCPDCVRGLLCVTCNNLLRAARDEERILRAAIVYLSRNSRAIAQGEDTPVAELLSRMFPKPDPRLLPRGGRRDRFFMMLLDAPAAAATVAEAGWMHDHDPEGYREALRRADPFYGGPGCFEDHLARIMPRIDDPDSRFFLEEVAVERAALGMPSPGLAGPFLTLGDINAHLRAKARGESPPS